VPQQTVLIIDDSIDIHDLIKVGIEDQGLQVHSLFDGSECAEVALRIQPDLILLDVDMPGANGFEVCQRLKASPQTAAFPVVFLTGASTAEEKLQGLKLGAVDYITKPFDPAELSARVRSALQTKHLIDLLAQQNSALQESESRFRLLAENSSDIISRVLPDGTCAYASPACRSVLRYPPEALVGQKVAELVHPEDRALLSELNLTPGRTAVFAARVRRGGGAGNYVWLETNVRPVSDASGTNVVELHASSREITRRKQAEFLEQDRSRVLELIAQNRELPTILTELACLLERQQPGGIAATLVSMEGTAVPLRSGASRGRRKRGQQRGDAGRPAARGATPAGTARAGHLFRRAPGAVGDLRGV
jgi:PAS domain S-box-containing protein